MVLVFLGYNDFVESCSDRRMLTLLWGSFSNNDGNGNENVIADDGKEIDKMKNARAERAKLLFFPTQYANLWRSRCRRRCRC